MTEKHHIFLSYSRKDEKIMKHVYNRLTAAELRVWIDNIELKPGTSEWQRVIKNALRLADYLVVILSPDAEKSEWVNIEISWAKEFGLTIYPVLFRGE
jgi:hypothetical protein